MVIGPLPTAGIPDYININDTYDDAGVGVVSWDLTDLTNPTMTVTYVDQNDDVTPYSLTIYRHCKSIEYTIIGGGGGGRKGVNGIQGSDKGGGGGGWAKGDNSTIGGQGGKGKSGSLVFVITF